MGPLFYILKTSLKNSVRELARKPLALIAYILMALFFILILATSIIVPPHGPQTGSVETFGILVSTAVAVFIYFGIRQGIAGGNSFFRQADVNLAFTAPISPQRVLVYGFIQQLLLTLMAVLFLLFQIPNLRNSFAISLAGLMALVAGVILLLFSIALIGMLVYSLSSRSARIRSGLEKALNILTGLFLAGFLAVLLEKRDLARAAALYLNNTVFDHLPLIGWFKMILVEAVRGIGPTFYINLALALASVALMIFVLYALKTDYYEDVLVATEYREQLLRAKKEGKAGWNFRKNTRVRRVTSNFTATGAMAVLQRHLLEYRKSGWFLVDRNSLFIIAIGVASKYFFPFSSMKTVLYVSAYLLFFYSLQGKWVQELCKPFIYLIPAGSAAKVFYTTLAEILKSGVDGLLLFAAAGFMFRSDVAAIVLCAIAYMTFAAVFTYGDVMARKCFGQSHGRTLAIFMKMFLLLFIIAPGIAVSVISGIILHGYGFADHISYLALIAYNLLACAIMALIARGLFESLEMG